MSVPPFSSGKPWTDQDDNRLARELVKLIKQFPNRSAPAIMSRIDYLQGKHYHANWPLGGERPKRGFSLKIGDLVSYPSGLPLPLCRVGKVIIAGIQPRKVTVQFDKKGPYEHIWVSELQLATELQIEESGWGDA